jgi:hypothetical protein
MANLWVVLINVVNDCQSIAHTIADCIAQTVNVIAIILI